MFRSAHLVFILLSIVTSSRAFASIVTVNFAGVDSTVTTSLGATITSVPDTTAFNGQFSYDSSAVGFVPPGPPPPPPAGPFPITYNAITNFSVTFGSTLYTGNFGQIIYIPSTFSFTIGLGPAVPPASNASIILSLGLPNVVFPTTQLPLSFNLSEFGTTSTIVSFIEPTIGPTTTDYIGSLTELSTIGSVPEPSTWAMMLLGFLAVGFAGYRKRPNSLRRGVWVPDELAVKRL